MSQFSADAVLGSRRFPIGAEVNGQETHFRVWAPGSRAVSVVLASNPDLTGARTVPLERESAGEGYFSGTVSDVPAEAFYKFRLDSGDFPDPASRFQPLGPHGPSQVVEPGAFLWKDSDWPGISAEGQVLYELHVGTFTPTGTWQSAEARLEYLADYHSRGTQRISPQGRHDSRGELCE